MQKHRERERHKAPLFDEHISNIIDCNRRSLDIQKPNLLLI